MSKSLRNACISAAALLLRPIAMLMIRAGIGFGEFSDLSKTAFVAAASDSIRKRKGRPTISRVAILTGLTRQEVSRILETGGPGKNYVWQLQRAERVLHGWHTDAKFLDSRGNPKQLPIHGDASFSELVKEYSGDIPYRAMLRELADAGLVREQKDKVTALKKSFSISGFSPAQVEEAGKIAAGVLATCVSNLDPTEERLFHRTISLSIDHDSAGAHIRKTIHTRSDRFIDALGDYLHSNLDPPEVTDPSESHAVLRITLIESVSTPTSESGIEND